MVGISSLFAALLLLLCTGVHIAVFQDATERPTTPLEEIVLQGPNEDIPTPIYDSSNSNNNALRELRGAHLATTTKYFINAFQGSINIEINFVSDSFRWNITPAYPASAAFC